MAGWLRRDPLILKRQGSSASSIDSALALRSSWAIEVVAFASSLIAALTALGGAIYGQYIMYLNPDTVSGIGVSLQIVFAAIGIDEPEIAHGQEMFRAGFENDLIFADRAICVS